MSTFAASTCSVESLPAVLRMNALRRSRIAVIVAGGVTPTQSPTAGSCPPTSWSWNMRPAARARSSPSSAKRTYSPRCCAATRAGNRLSSCSWSNAAANAASHPRESRGNNASLLCE